MIIASDMQESGCDANDEGCEANNDDDAYKNSDSSEAKLIDCGDILPRYHDISPLGCGAKAIVFSAIDQNCQKRIAVKKVMHICCSLFFNNDYCLVLAAWTFSAFFCCFKPRVMTTYFVTLQLFSSVANLC